MKLIIFGPQASGKGTQAELLAQELNIKHISTGEILREEVRAGTPLGMQVKEMLERGDLVPTDTTNELTKQAMDSSPNGYILDGYPREDAQAEFLDEVDTVDHVILLSVPDTVSIERISGRRECPKGHDYHIKYDPPKEEGICDEDGLPLQKRSDDTEEAIRHRLDIFHKQTEPLLARYKDKLLEIDGTPSIEEVHKAVLKALG